MITTKIMMDSGAFGLYSHKIAKRKYSNPNQNSGAYLYYDSAEFFQYLDKYAAFVKRRDSSSIIDHYITVDSIMDFKRTERNQRYLELKGLHPMIVFHLGAPLDHIKRVIEENNYTYIGLGGSTGTDMRSNYFRWADPIFDALPQVKFHGFAATSLDVLKRYPWESVDSATWLRQAAYGMVKIPENSDFSKEPWTINISDQNTQYYNKTRSRGRTSLLLLSRNFPSLYKIFCNYYQDIFGEELKEPTIDGLHAQLLNIIFFIKYAQENNIKMYLSGIKTLFSKDEHINFTSKIISKNKINELNMLFSFHDLQTRKNQEQFRTIINKIKRRFSNEN